MSNEKSNKNDKVVFFLLGSIISLVILSVLCFFSSFLFILPLSLSKTSEIYTGSMDNYVESKALYEYLMDEIKEDMGSDWITDKNNDYETRYFMNDLGYQIETYYSENGSYPSSLYDLNIRYENDNFEVVSDDIVMYNDYQITYTYDDEDFQLETYMVWLDEKYFVYNE